MLMFTGLPNVQNRNENHKKQNDNSNFNFRIQKYLIEKKNLKIPTFIKLF
jgi:hypothetical protein